MKRISKLAIIALALAVLFAGCELFEVLLAPTGSVINAKTGSGIGGVTVTLKAFNENGTIATSASATTTTSSSGSAIFTKDVKSGKYLVQASLSDYVFTEEVVTIGGWNQTIPTLYGLTPAKSTDVSIFLTWETTQDLDAHFYYPAGIETNSYNATSYLPTTFSAYPDSDNYPGSTTHVYFQNKQNTSNTVFAKLDVDKITGYGPETITLDGDKIGYGTGRSITVSSSSPDNLGSVLSAGNYKWMGFGTYYLDSYSGTLAQANTAASAGAKVVVTQGTSIIGKYTLPTYMSIEKASILKVHVFVDSSAFYLVFYPEINNVDIMKSVSVATPFVATIPR